MHPCLSRAFLSQSRAAAEPELPDCSTSCCHIQLRCKGLMASLVASQIHEHYSTLCLNFKGKLINSFVKTHLPPRPSKLHMPEG